MAPHSIKSKAANAAMQYSVKRNQFTGVSSKARLNDAVVLGDLEAPAAQTVLKSAFVVGYSDRAPRVAATKWLKIEGTFEDALYVLTQHPVQKKKEGSAYFFNETELTGQTVFRGGKDYACTHRKKEHAKSVTAFAIDVDGTDCIRRVRDELFKLGFFGVLYTTHSHARKRSKGKDYFRVIIPLASPFVLADHTSEKMYEAEQKWQAHYAGFTAKLGFQKVDLSAAKLVQMMYLPRRVSADAPFEHYVVAGRALKLEDMPCAHPAKQTPANRIHDGCTKKPRSAKRVQKGSVQNFSAPRHVLGDGFDARAFFQDYGDRFKLLAFLKALRWDVRNLNAGTGNTIKCPNHREHTEPDNGSDSGCWASPPDAQHKAVIVCHHHHCRHLRIWNFFPLIEDALAGEEAFLPKKFKTLSQMICSEEFYYDHQSS